MRDMAKRSDNRLTVLDTKKKPRRFRAMGRGSRCFRGHFFPCQIDRKEFVKTKNNIYNDVIAIVAII